MLLCHAPKNTFVVGVFQILHNCCLTLCHLHVPHDVVCIFACLPPVIFLYSVLFKETAFHKNQFSVYHVFRDFYSKLSFEYYVMLH